MHSHSHLRLFPHNFEPGRPRTICGPWNNDRETTNPHHIKRHTQTTSIIPLKYQDICNALCNKSLFLKSDARLQIVRMQTQIWYRMNFSWLSFIVVSVSNSMQAVSSINKTCHDDCLHFSPWLTNEMHWNWNYTIHSCVYIIYWARIKHVCDNDCMHERPQRGVTGQQSCRWCRWKIHNLNTAVVCNL